MAATGEEWELIVVDDGALLTSAPEGVRLVSLAQPRGYGPAVNAGVAVAKGDLLLVLNDDVRLEESTVRILRDTLLGTSGVFAVSPAIRSPLARCGDEGGKAAVHRAGLIEIEEVTASEVHPTLYPVGCCYLCSRAVFVELEGYDDVYAPFFWEDVDLGYRAWRRGLASLHVPAAVCHHEGSATLGTRPFAERQRAWYRNWMLFHLRNLQDPDLRAASLGAWAAYALFDGRPAVKEGLAQALRLYAEVGRRDGAGLADAQIVARSSSP
jgi:GT2 family glycosyltransferase